MTVRELIEQLAKADPDAVVLCAGAEIDTSYEGWACRDAFDYWREARSNCPDAKKSVTLV